MPLFIFFLVACDVTPWEAKNPHQGENSSLTQLYVGKRESVKKDWVSIDRSIPLNSHFQQLFESTNFHEPKIYLNDQFEADLSWFIGRLSKSQGEDSLIEAFSHLMIERCPIEATLPCQEIEVLKNDPLSHLLILKYLGQLKPGELQAKRPHLIWIGANLASQPSAQWVRYLAENYKQIVTEFDGFAEAVRILIGKHLGIVSSVSEKGLFDNNQVSQISDLDFIDFFLERGRQNSQEEIRSIQKRLAQLAKNSGPELLKEVLQKDPRSFLHYVKTKDGSFFRKGNDEGFYCSFLTDRLFRKSLDPYFVRRALRYDFDPNSCLVGIKTVLFFEMLQVMDEFVARALTEKKKLSKKGVAFSDILNEIRQKLADHSILWSNYMDQADRILDIFSLGIESHEVKQEISQLRISMEKNFLIYVQFPLNLAFVKFLENHYTIALGFGSVVTQRIDNLLKDIFQEGKYFMPLPIVDQSKVQLSLPEMLASLDFSLKFGLFEKLGTSSPDIFKTIYGNFLTPSFVKIKQDFRFHEEAYRTDGYSHIYSKCEDVISTSLKEELSLKPGLFTREIKELPFALFMSHQSIQNNHISVNAETRSDQIMSAIQGLYVPYFSLMDSFLEVWKKNGASDQDVQQMSLVLNEKRKVLSDFVIWHNSKVNKMMSCLWSYFRKNWSLFLKVMDYEASYLGSIYDRVKSKRNLDPVDFSEINQFADRFNFSTLKSPPALVGEDQFYNYSVPLHVRVGHYLKYGYGQKPALAPNLNLQFNFDSMKPSLFHEKRTLNLNLSKKGFVEAGLRHLLGTENVDGLLTLRFFKGNFALLMSLIKSGVAGYLVDDKILQEENPFGKVDINRMGLEFWDIVNIGLRDQSFQYDEEWVLKNQTLSEKFPKIAKFSHSEKLAVSDHFLNGEALPPLGFVYKNLASPESPKYSDQVDQDGGSGKAREDMTVTRQALTYFLGRSNLAKSLYDLDEQVIQPADRFFKDIMESRFVKMKQAYCYSVQSKDDLLDKVGLTMNQINSKSASLSFAPYSGSALAGESAVSHINSRIHSFFTKIPYSLRDQPEIIPVVPYLVECGKVQ